VRADDQRLLQLLAHLLPYREESIVAALESFLAQAESLSGVAILGFLVTALLTFFGVQQTLFRIFGVERAPALGRRLVTFSILFFWGPLLVGTAQAGYLLLGQSRPELAATLDASPLFGLLPAGVTFLGLAMLVWRAAAGRVRFREAALGSLFSTAALEALGELFEVYVAQFTAVQRAVYGTFAIVLFFVVSIQLAWWILLLGAEIAAVLAERRRGAGPARARPHAHVPDPWLGLGALELLAARGRPTLAAGELAPALGLDPPAAVEQLRPLVEAGLVEAGLAGGGDRYRLALPPQRIRIASVLAIYRRLLAAAAESSLPPRAAALRVRLRHALERDLGEETLADLAGGRPPGAHDRADEAGAQDPPAAAEASDDPVSRA
jgi:membrane protein